MYISEYSETFVNGKKTLNQMSHIPFGINVIFLLYEKHSRVFIADRDVGTLLCTVAIIFSEGSLFAISDIRSLLPNIYLSQPV